MLKQLFNYKLAKELAISSRQWNMGWCGVK